MKNLYLIITIAISISLFSTTLSYAGNDDRKSEGGATELLINPWARSSGWADANVACVVGLEAMYQNIAGMAFTPKLELAFTNTQYLVGTGIKINSGGFVTRVGKENGGVLGLSVMNMNFGEIDITTVQMPDGGIGTFSPSYSVIGLAYAREFSNSIYGGITAKIINENIANVGATGFALDAGIQYVTGIGHDKFGDRNRDNLRLGITMKNVGTSMKYSGDGLAFTGFSQNGTQMTVAYRSQEFELPFLLKIGASYHIKLYQNKASMPMNSDNTGSEAADDKNTDHELIIAANFTSNSYTKDQIHLGLEYTFRNYFSLRGGYIYEEGIESITTSTNVLTGPTAGLSLQSPISKDNKSSVIAFDYSYRLTRTFGGIHTFGVRISM